MFGVSKVRHEMLKRLRIERESQEYRDAQIRDSIKDLSEDLEELRGLLARHKIMDERKTYRRREDLEPTETVGQRCAEQWLQQNAYWGLGRGLL